MDSNNRYSSPKADTTLVREPRFKDAPRTLPPAAFAALVTHWILLFGWGLALNDSASGYLYCRLVMLGIPNDTTPWLFTVGGCLAMIGLGTLDRLWLRKSLVVAILPTPLFMLTQAFAMWLHLSSIRS